VHHGQALLHLLLQRRDDLGANAAPLVGRSLGAGERARKVGGVEDVADGGGSLLSVSVGDLGRLIALKVGPASLPGGTLEVAGHGGLESRMGVGGHELDPTKPALL